jgi:hypothetical protein
MVLGLAVSATSYLFGRLRFRRRDTRTGEVLFSERGVLQPSGYLPFRGVNLTLVDVVIEDGEPAVLRFRVGSVTENFTTREQVFRVPIPKGREADAADLAAYLQGKTVPVRDRPTATSVATT